jgi:hypothetical protein
MELIECKQLCRQQLQQIVSLKEELQDCPASAARESQLHLMIIKQPGESKLLPNQQFLHQTDTGEAASELSKLILEQSDTQDLLQGLDAQLQEYMHTVKSLQIKNAVLEEQLQECKTVASAGWFKSANEVAAEFAGVAQRTKEQSALVHLEQAQLTITDLAQQLRAANKQLFDEIQGTQLLQVVVGLVCVQKSLHDHMVGGKLAVGCIVASPGQHQAA